MKTVKNIFVFLFGESIQLFDFLILDEELIFDDDGNSVGDESTSTQILIAAEKVSKTERKEIQFMSILSRVGGDLLSKSLAPAMKFKKKKAAEKMAELLLLETGDAITPEQICKKVCFYRFSSF